MRTVAESEKTKKPPDGKFAPDMKISVEAAREYLRHPSQQLDGVQPGDLVADFDYYADGAACLVVHATAKPDIWMVHIMVDPDGWGRLDAKVSGLLREVWQDKKPKRLIAWIEDDRRAAVALVKRIGCTRDGKMANYEMWGWSWA